MSVWVQRGALAWNHGYPWEKEAREIEERQREALLGSIRFHGIKRISKNCKSELAALLYCHPAWTFKLTICCEFFFHFFFSPSFWNHAEFDLRDKSDGVKEEKKGVCVCVCVCLNEDNIGWEEPLDEGMATPSHILAWRIPLESGAWWATVHGVAESNTTDVTKHSHKSWDIWEVSYWETSGGLRT